MNQYHSAVRESAEKNTALLLGAFAATALLAFLLAAPSAHAAPTATINLSGTTAVIGASYTLTWSSTGAASCSVVGPGFASSALSGSQPFTQSTLGAKNYSIVCATAGCTWSNPVTLTDCFGSGNECSPNAACTSKGSICENTTTRMVGGEPMCSGTQYTCAGSCTSASGSDSITIIAPPAPTVNLTSNKATIAYGNSATLSWTSTNASVCTGTGFSTGNATSGSVVVSPKANASYSISCSGYTAPAASDSVAIAVTGVPAPVLSFTASPTTVTLGNTSTLTWSATDASSCTGTGFSTGGSPSGSAQVTPATNTSYSLSCTGQGGSDSGSVGVGVTGVGGGGGVTVFDNSDGFIKAYVLPDANANGGVSLNDTSAIYAGWANERERACDLVDPTSFPTAWSTRSYTSPGNNSVLKYSGGLWAVYGASGNNTKYSWLTCRTNAKPDASLTANGTAANATITVAAGTAVNLTWLSQYGQVRKSTCSAQNFATDTWIPGRYVTSWECDPSCGNGNAVCASAPQKKSLATRVLNFLGIQPDVAQAAGGCFKTTTWVPGHTANDPYDGSTTVNPLVTTTYTYTCANANGSVAKSITVNVPTGPQCADGLDNDSDGLIDLADPGCMNNTDTTEDPDPPAPPVLSAVSCSADGKIATLNWSDTSANGYYLRAGKPTAGVCPGNLIPVGWAPDVCIPSPDLVSPSTYVLNPVVPGTAYSYWVHSRTATGEWSQPTTGSFTCTARPELTTSVVAPSTATTGSPVTFSATVTNSGGSTATNFKNSFVQNGLGWFAPTTGATMTLAPGVPGTVTYNHSAPSTPGSWQVAFCADMDQTSSHAGTVTEQNENNNCSGGNITWTTITVTDPVTQCSDLVDNDGDGLIDMADPGCTAPSDATEFPNPGLLCANLQDDDGDGLIDMADPGCSGPGDNTESPNPPTVTLSPAAATINNGQSVTLSWSSPTATGCTFTDPSPTGTAVANIGTRPVSPTSNSTYDIFCSNAAGNSAHSFSAITVTVPSVFITADKTRVNGTPSSPATVNLTWSAQQIGVASCSMTKNGSAFTPTGAPANLTPNGAGNIATTTPVAQSITGQSVYKLTCGGISSQVVINVNGGGGEF